MSSSDQKKLDQVKSLRRSGKTDEAISILTELLSDHPSSAEANCLMAWCLDSLGREREAIPHYEAAIANGIQGEERKGTYLGLGSTLRCLGQYEKSLEVFEKAIGEFPEHRALKVFRAMVLHNLGRSSEGLGVLILELLDTTTDEEIRTYDRALRFYADKLDQTW